MDMPLNILGHSLEFSFALAVPLLAGSVTIAIIASNENIDTPLWLGTSYLLGTGLLAQAMLILGSLHCPLTVAHISMVMAFYILGLGALGWFKKYRPSHRHAPKLVWEPGKRFLFYLALAYIICQMAYVFWTAVNFPIYHQVAAYSTYAMKAKIFFYSQLLVQGVKVVPSTYPLQVPLTMTWAALNTGQWSETWARMPLAFNGLAFVLIFYGCLKQWTNTFIACLGAALMCTALFFIESAGLVYCDFPLMAYTMSCFLFMGWGLYKRQSRFILLAGIMAGFGMAVKLNGIPYFVIEFLILCWFLFIKMRPLPRLFVYKSVVGLCLPPLAVMLIYQVYVFEYGIHKLTWYGRHWTMPHNWQAIQHLWVAAGALFSCLFFSGNWGVLWFLLVGAGLIHAGRKLPFAVVFFSTALAAFFLNYVLALLFTDRFINLAGVWYLDTLPRMVLHFFPLCPLLIMLLVDDYLRSRPRS